MSTQCRSSQMGPWPCECHNFQNESTSFDELSFWKSATHSAVRSSNEKTFCFFSNEAQMFASIHPPNYWPVCLLICASIYLSTYWSIYACIFFHRPTHLSTPIVFCRPTHPSSVSSFIDPFFFFFRVFYGKDVSCVIGRPPCFSCEDVGHQIRSKCTLVLICATLETWLMDHGRAWVRASSFTRRLFSKTWQAMPPFEMRCVLSFEDFPGHSTSSFPRANPFLRHFESRQLWCFCPVFSPLLLYGCRLGQLCHHWPVHIATSRATVMGHHFKVLFLEIQMMTSHMLPHRGASNSMRRWGVRRRQLRPLTPLTTATQVNQLKSLSTQDQRQTSQAGCWRPNVLARPAGGGVSLTRPKMSIPLAA